MEHADKMGLSDDQMAKIKPIHHDIEKKQARFNADQKITEIELKEIMEVKNFDLEKAGATVKKSADIKSTYQLEMLKAMKEVHAILTDDQFKNMKKMMTMMHEKTPSKHMKKK
jgi:Spy/CpxP family protein refolding chaperone